MPARPTTRRGLRVSGMSSTGRTSGRCSPLASASPPFGGAPRRRGALFCSCGARPKSALHRAVDESRRGSRLTPLSTSPLTLGDVRGVQPHGGEAVAGVWYANVGVLAGPAQRDCFDVLLAVVLRQDPGRDGHRLAEPVLRHLGREGVEDALARRPGVGLLPLLIGPPPLHTAKCPTCHRRCGSRWAPRTGGAGNHTGVTLRPWPDEAGTGRPGLASKQHEQCAP